MARGPKTGDTVVRCIACGAAVERSAAREYDRYGDRWDRADKQFEFLCKPCHRRECHLPRDGLEQILSTIGTQHGTASAFVAAYYEELTERADPDEGPGG